MARRFTDTGKWDKKWFRELGCKHRDLRQYILDRCDHAGILELDLKTFEHFIGEQITLDDISISLRGNFELIDDKIFARDFIEFQYRVSVEGLNPSNKVHFSVLNRLKALGIFKPLASPLQAAKEKKKDKDKDKDKDRLVEKVLQSLPPFTTDQLTKKYPEKFRETAEACVLYHSNNPNSQSWSGGKWGMALTAWFLEEVRRGKDRTKKPKDPEFGGWAERDGIA